MLALKIALRFIRTSPVQSILIVGGIAVGIAVQVFVGSLITSLQASLIERTIGSSPHVTLSAPEEGDPFVYDAQTKRVVRGTDEVKAVVPERDISAVFSQDNDQVVLGIRGGELADLNSIYRLRQRTVSGTPSLASGEIMVGTDFADKYSIAPGDALALTASTGEKLSLTVSGIFDLGSAAANERTAFTGPDVPRRVLGYRPDEYSLVAAQLTDPFESSKVGREWDLRLPQAAVSDWQVDNKDLLGALQSQSSSSYMIQVFVLIAVALGIASTLAISAVQKTRQIGILKALGMADGATGRIFLWEAGLLGALGTTLGVGLGYFLIFGFTFGTSSSPSSFAIVVDPAFLMISAGVGMLVALLSAIIPMRKTSRLDPIEVIQNG